MRSLTFTTVLLAALPWAFAQWGEKDVSSGKNTTATGIQTVAVGEDGLSFTPNTITAAVGSKVQFVFYPRTHSVAQSSFASPCVPLNGSAFFSGLMNTTSPGPNTNTFTITINNTDPIWFYCTYPSHCESGMSGVINEVASSAKNLTAYQAAASGVSKSVAPSTVQGGVIGPAAAGSSTSSTASNTSATTSATTSTSTTTTSSSGAVSKTTSRPVMWVGMGIATLLACGVGMVL